MSATDFSQVPTEELQRRYWMMPVVSDEDDATIEALCVELIKRKVSLNDTLTFLMREMDK